MSSKREVIWDDAAIEEMRLIRSGGNSPAVRGPYTEDELRQMARVRREESERALLDPSRRLAADPPDWGGIMSSRAQADLSTEAERIRDRDLDLGLTDRLAAYRTQREAQERRHRERVDREIAREDLTKEFATKALAGVVTTQEAVAELAGKTGLEPQTAERLLLREARRQDRVERNRQVLARRSASGRHLGVLEETVGEAWRETTTHNLGPADPMYAHHDPDDEPTSAGDRVIARAPRQTVYP